MQSDDGFSFVAFDEADGFARHIFNGNGGLWLHEGCGVGVCEAEEPMQAVEFDGAAGVVVVLHQKDVRGGVVVFQKDVVGEIDTDLRAGFFGAVARDATERVAHVEAVAVVGNENDDDGDGKPNPFFHAVSDAFLI